MVRRVDGLIRTDDTFARYGGEEFVLLLPETPLDRAVALAERVRNAVEAGIRGSMRTFS